LVELLVILGVIAVLASVAFPVLARTKPSSKGFQCMANTKTLMMANLMYQGDNGDTFPMVMHGGFVPSGPNDPNRPWATGWLDWTTSTDNTNLNYLLNPTYASLAAYFGRDKTVYKCPADVYISTVQQAMGWTTRVRSVSANVYVGRGNAWTTLGGGPSGPSNLSTVNGYKGAAKSSDLNIPGPAGTWVYMDEHPDSINDPCAFAPVSASDMPDAPATFHNGAAGFAFADGHSEIHRWRGSTMNAPWLLSVNFNAMNNFGCKVGDPDLYWFAYHTPRWTTRTPAN
jgi:prepilin-type processing-associated H-X9-DG protein